MLILTRNINQRIMIGSDTVIKLLSFNRNYVILNITDSLKSENIELYEGQYIVRNNFKLAFESRCLSQVRFAIEAPRDVPVYREEIFNKLQA